MLIRIMGCSATKHTKVQENPTVSKNLPKDSSQKNTETNNNNTADTNVLDQPIGTREEKDVGKPIPAGTVIKDELLSPKASAIRKSRSISIKTDDGVGDVEEKETADQADLDVEKMYSALHQFNVFEKDLISLIVSKRISYRQLLRTKYTEKYDEDLVKTVRHNTCGGLQYLLTNLLYTPEEFLATLMKQFVEKNEYIHITEALTAWNSSVISNAKLRYFDMYDCSFSDDVTKSLTDKVPKSLKDIMISISTLNRNENNREIEDSALIGEAADSLSQGADEILELLTRKPYSKATLASIFEQYKLRYYLDITDSIDIEFHDDSQKVLSTIVRTADNSAKYFTTQLKQAVQKKDEQRVVNILIGRHTVDLAKISKEYEEQFGTSFTDAVLGVFSEEYKNPLKVFFKYQVK